ncbi:hypothetical protein ONZ43_g2206 [Nemania bipapillata]|uniref:Uncharacterized protein n=1 Tax=Nemania bipapillata TaxID=110536 RepID=A0ACC2J1I3_9PEZI|nr:hypothetical protein ONZ43_g2206 [Nemania bipapillata]
MDSLGEETWDTVICGTGLSQSLLALALSRSKKRILHLDPNDFYGEHEAALSLQEADSWARAHASPGNILQLENQPTPSKQDPDKLIAQVSDAADRSSEEPNLVDAAKSATVDILSGIDGNIFRNAHVWKHPNAEAQGLSFPRAYSLALAPQIIHTKSRLLSQLVLSKAYRQIEFLAVGSFFIYSTVGSVPGARLARIPSSREDVFSAQSIPARSKRKLMKFLKFVIDYDSDEHKPIWQEKADQPLSAYLVDEFNLDKNLGDSILALTLCLDGNVTVKDGLATVHRHLTSIGLFGPGFCAVYPKWGGMSEIAQTCSATSQAIARLVAIIDSPLQSLFETLAEGAPTPAVAMVAFPSGSLSDDSQPSSGVPVYAFVHSSDTGECPSGQSVVYLTMQATPLSSHALDSALIALLQAVMPTAAILYKLYYEQAITARNSSVTSQSGAIVFEFPSPSLGLAYDDESLDAVKEAWRLVMKDEASDDSFMQFEDREGLGDDDDD